MFFAILLFFLIFLLFLKFHFVKKDNLILKSATHWNNTFVPFFALCSLIMGILHFVNFLNQVKLFHIYPESNSYLFFLFSFDTKSLLPLLISNKNLLYHLISSVILIIYGIIGILLVKRNGLYDKGICIYSDKYDWHSIKNFDWINPNNKSNFYYLSFTFYNEDILTMKIPINDKAKWDTVLRRKF